MKLSKEDFLKELKDYTGDRTDDETLKIVEDASDSWSETEEDPEDWKGKYEDLAKKYKDRFSETVVKEEPDEKDDEEEKKEKINIDDLFKEED